MPRIRVRGSLTRLYPQMILHLYALSTATASPGAIVEIAGNSRLALSELSKTFSKIALLVSKWNYALHKAAYLVASRVRERKVKGFLQRLAHSLNMGVSLEGFMKMEYEKLLATMTAEFDRALEKTKKYIEAYSALLTSSAFLSVSMLLTSMIYGMDVVKVLSTTALMVAASLTAIVILIARTIPSDPVLHPEPSKPELLSTLERLNTPLAAASLAASALIALAAQSPQTGNALLDSLTPTPLALIAAGIPPLLIGRLGRRWVKKAEELDEHYPTFAKSLGDALEVTGSLKGACKILMMNDYGPLNRLLKRLYKRLQAGFQQHKALHRLGLESLSNLTLRMSGLLADNLRYGSKASACTKAIHDYSLNHLINRKKRRQVAGSLKGIAIPLQATIAAISALISVLTKILSRFASLISTWFPVVSSIPQHHITTFFYAVITATAAASAAAIYYVEGDSRFTLTHSLGLLLTLSGAIHYAASAASETLFGIFTAFEEGISELLEEV